LVKVALGPSNVSTSGFEARNERSPRRLSASDSPTGRKRRRATRRPCQCDDKKRQRKCHTQSKQRRRIDTVAIRKLDYDRFGREQDAADNGERQA